MTPKATRSPVRTQAGDLGTSHFKLRHNVEIEVRERHSNGESKTIGCRVKDQTPIDRYYNRRQLDKDSDINYILFQAGERLAADFYYSGLMAKTTSSYEPRIKGVFHFMEHKEDRLRSYRNALKSIAYTLKPILIHVCCIHGTAQEWAVRNSQPTESGIVILRLALRELAIHYGLMKKPLDTSAEHKLQIMPS